MERASREKNLKDLDRKKYLVPPDLPLMHFMSIIRKRLSLDCAKALFLLINGKVLVSLTKEMESIYEEHKSNDGLLHITYATQECFGSDSSVPVELEHR